MFGKSKKNGTPQPPTTRAERLDPESWKAVVGGALARSSGVIERHGGTVAQLLGDGLLAFFGAPTAHEDDALRAVRAGLELVAPEPGAGTAMSPRRSTRGSSSTCRGSRRRWASWPPR